jgi:hypothetical protein
VLCFIEKYWPGKGVRVLKYKPGDICVYKWTPAISPKIEFALILNLTKKDGDHNIDIDFYHLIALNHSREHGNFLSSQRTGEGTISVKTIDLVTISLEEYLEKQNASIKI